MPSLIFYFQPLLHPGRNFQYVICGHWVDFPEKEITHASIGFLYIVLLLS